MPQRPTPQRFTPHWLIEPVDEAAILAGQADWRRLEDRWGKVWMGFALLAIALMVVAGVLMATGHDTLGMGFTLASTLSIGVSTVYMVPLMGAQSWRRSCQPLPEEKMAGFTWLLDHALDGQALKAELAARPRAPREGELYALQSAYRASKTRNDPAVPRTS